MQILEEKLQFQRMRLPRTGHRRSRDLTNTKKLPSVADLQQGASSWLAIMYPNMVLLVRLRLTAELILFTLLRRPHTGQAVDGVIRDKVCQQRVQHEIPPWGIPPAHYGLDSTSYCGFKHVFDSAT